MKDISAFVGHSFREEDEGFVRKLLDFLDTVVKSVPGFRWDHAKGAEPKQVFDKVIEKFEGKNLFIGICSSAELVTSAASVRVSRMRRDNLVVQRTKLQPKCSDWVTQ